MIAAVLSLALAATPMFDVTMSGGAKQLDHSTWAPADHQVDIAIDAAAEDPRATGILLGLVGGIDFSRGTGSDSVANVSTTQSLFRAGARESWRGRRFVAIGQFGFLGGQVSSTASATGGPSTTATASGVGLWSEAGGKVLLGAVEAGFAARYSWMPVRFPGGSTVDAGGIAVVGTIGIRFHPPE